MRNKDYLPFFQAICCLSVPVSSIMAFDVPSALPNPRGAKVSAIAVTDEWTNKKHDPSEKPNDHGRRWILEKAAILRGGRILFHNYSVFWAMGGILDGGK